MELSERIFEAGIVGCGGAGFPTNVKYENPAEVFIVNGAECEPLLGTDKYLMRHNAARIIKAADAVADMLHAKDTVIALKEHYKREAAALSAEIEKTGSRIRIFELGNFYPAGDEQVLVYEVTKRIVPPAGLPADVGVTVSNIGTMNAVCDAMEGRSFTHKYLTVTGAVRNPCIYKVPIGTPMMACVEDAIPEYEDCDYIMGGPMMGHLYTRREIEKQVITKTVSGIVVLPSQSYIGSRYSTDLRTMLRRARSCCIQCSICTELCSRHMLGHPIKPSKIMRKFAISTDISQIMEDEDVKQALICSECGICEEYACPMGLQPRKINQIIKELYREEGVKYAGSEERIEADIMREYRKIPTRHLALRIGLSGYYGIDLENFKELNPGKVIIPLKQNAGVQSTAVVSEGDKVVCGQLIARCPEGQLGANQHASIDGVVKSVCDRITIEG